MHFFLQSNLDAGWQQRNIIGSTRSTFFTLALVSQTFSSSNVLVVVPNLPVANLAEFIAIEVERLRMQVRISGAKAD